ncbi:GDSL-type esterase/lipase family protein [Nocardia mexicana]|uniref:GDSL-type esterase/lipase family protein n=1 Tax=Nocardia mexicana TaxID=279262 RepID=UPI00083638A8|nr:GDSL-type esterase/lipase family protein [Nocardia mexicana]
MVRDVRICFVGDSLVAGLGDRQCLGWAGRLAARAAGAGQPLTYYNLGVRGQTSTEIAERWEDECALRLPAEADGRVVFSFGVNDTMSEDGRAWVATEQSVANLAAMLRRTRELGWPTLMVAPPPVDDDEHNSRTEKLDAEFSDVCDAEGVSYVRVHQPLRHSGTWMREVAEDDGYHPGAAGYEEFAALIVPHWLLWLSEPGSGLPVVR